MESKQLWLFERPSPTAGQLAEDIEATKESLSKLRRGIFKRYVELLRENREIKRILEEILEKKGSHELPPLVKE